MVNGWTYPLAAFQRIDWVVLAGYFGLMILVGFLAGSRKSGSAHEYFLAGRSLPSFLLAISIVATTLSAVTFIGVPDEVYLGNIGYLILFLGSLLAVFIVALLFVPRLYRAGTVTVYGYLRPRFGEGAVIAVSCTFLIGRLLASGARLFAAAIPLTLLMFGTTRPAEHKEQLILAICMIGLIGTFYTVKGGIRAVVWTDAIQLLLVIGAAVLTIGLLYSRIGKTPAELWSILSDPANGPDGYSKLHLIDTSFDFGKTYTVWAAVFGFVFLNVANYGVDHDFAQRFLVSKSPWRGGVSVIVSQFVNIGVVCLFMVVGLLLFVFYKKSGIPNYAPTGKKLDSAYPIFILNEFPPVLMGLAIAGFFAVAQGSMDSAINAMASSAVADIYLPLRKKRGYTDSAAQSSRAPRVAVAMIGVLLCLFAIGCVFTYNPNEDSLLKFALGIMNYALSGMLGVFITALFTRRGNSVTVVLALIAGAITIALLQPGVLGTWTDVLFGKPFKLAMPWWMPIGTTVSFAVCFAGSPRGS